MTHPGGRPTDYKPEYCEQARKLCLLGHTDEELAEYFEVDVRTIGNWKNNHPEFFQALKDGKENADTNVTDRLYQRAMGYEHEDVDIKIYKGKVIKTTLTKYYPPDTTAAIFWLKNRQKLRWRDKHEIEHSGSIDFADRLNAARERAKHE